jgi:hypothetical protein
VTHPESLAACQAQEEGAVTPIDPAPPPAPMAADVALRVSAHEALPPSFAAKMFVSPRSLPIIGRATGKSAEEVLPAR